MARTNWKDYPSTATPINAANLNNIETRIEQALTNADNAQHSADNAQHSADNALKTLVQSGSSTTTVDANGTFVVTFPTPFAAPPTVVMMDGGQGSGAAYYKVTSTPPTATQIRLLACRADGTALAQGAAIRYNWIAVGTRP